MVPRLEFMPRLNWLEAQQKMQCAPRNTNSSIENVSEGGSYSLSRKSLVQNNHKASLKESEVSALVWTNPDRRYVILAFVAPLPPLQGPDQRNQPGSESNGNMDGFILLPASAISFQVDPQRDMRNPPHRACSAKSFPTSSFFGSNVMGQSRNRGDLVNRRTKMSKLPGSSSQQNSYISSDSSSLIRDGSNANFADDLVKDLLKEDKPVKRSSKKKAKKKGKHCKKRSRGTDSTRLEAFVEEGIHGSSVSETCTNDDLVENAMPLVVSLKEITVDVSDSEENSNCIINHSETSMTVTSYSDEVDASRTTVPSVPHKFASEDSIINSANVIHTSGDAHLNQISHCNGISSEVFCDGHGAPMLDAFSDGWNSDGSTSAGVAAKEKRISFSKPYEDGDFRTSLHGPGKRDFSYGNFSNGVVDSDSYAERAKCDSQSCSSSDMHLVVSGKRGRQGRKLPRVTDGIHRFSNAENVHGRIGKENNITVWQKVRRNDVDECICERNDENTAVSQFDLASKKPPSYKRVSNVVNSDVLLNTKDDNNLKMKGSEKVKRKPSTGSKQEYYYHSRKGPHANKGNSNRATNMNLLPEALEIPYQVSHHKDISIGLGQTDRVDCNPSEPVQNSQVCLDEPKQLGIVCDMVDKEQNQNSLPLAISESLDQTHLLEVRSHGEVHLPVSKGAAKLETEVSCAEFGKQDHISGSFLQRWMPVVRKDAEMASTRRSDKLSKSHLDGSVTDGPLKKIEEEGLSSSAHSLVPVMEAEVACLGSCFGDVNSPPLKDKGRLENFTFNNTSTSKAHGRADCLLRHESEDHNICVNETYSNKIAKAVNDAYKIQLASESVQLATGSPLAEFERLLCSASPVLGQTQSLLRCQSCSQDQSIGTFLCRHEIPNISLGSLWQWYDKHGSYGLEVRGVDYQNSKRMVIDRFDFRAYFVPFLSAVQLFGNSRSCSMNTRKVSSSAEMLKACDANHASEKSSDVSHLPIISVLLPRPRGENKTSPPENSSSASGQVELCNHSPSDDSELLFEYFESEQPQQRQPLFEKIKELVRGDGPSNFRGYGDPTKLVSLDMQDLHPASWYAVAWYPIYRIPDGNFRAAFLTYHSLGHLVRSSTSSYCLDGDSCIVSPVVGLQSYNAQGECWFQLRQHVTTRSEEISSFNRYEILKERLRTLEETASIMARGVVSKGNEKSMNRQSDYEFFLSRRRW